MAAFRDGSETTVAAFSPGGVLGLGPQPGAPFPEAGNPNPPYLSIWSGGDRPLVNFGAVNPGGSLYAGAVGQLGVTSAGPNYGDAHLMLRTMTAQATEQDTLTLGNGSVWVWDGKHWKPL